MKVPKYYQVKQEIEQLIDPLEPGAPIPTERELAERFSTSRTTVRQAIADLVVAGRLERTQGSGTFVSQPKAVQIRQLTSFSDDLTSQGLDPGDKILAVERMAAPADVARALGVRAGSWVYRLERLRGAHGDPIAHETAWLVGRFPRLGPEVERRGSLYRTLREVYDVELGEVVDEIETVLAAPREAALLGVETGLPMLLIHRTGYDRSGCRVEWTRSVFRGDRFKFVATKRLGD